MIVYGRWCDEWVDDMIDDSRWLKFYVYIYCY